MAGIFVTGTGTDIGKTFVAGALIRSFRRRGKAVDALKPVVSGFDSSAATASDSGVLLDALGLPVTTAELDRISPWRFAASLSPDMAARREGRSIDFSALLAFSRAAATRDGLFTVIEGVGGIMVPLDERHTVLDWMVELSCPLLLVAGSYLGSISHTLSALDVLRHRRLTVAAVAVSESAVSPAPLTETLGTLARFVSGMPVLGIERLERPRPDHPTIECLADLLAGRNLCSPSSDAS
jgi:dethiobiotin synthetase